MGSSGPRTLLAGSGRVVGAVGHGGLVSSHAGRTVTVSVCLPVRTADGLFSSPAHPACVTREAGSRGTFRLGWVQGLKRCLLSLMYGHDPHPVSHWSARWCYRTRTHTSQNAGNSLRALYHWLVLAVCPHRTKVPQGAEWLEALHPNHRHHPTWGLGYWPHRARCLPTWLTCPSPWPLAMCHSPTVGTPRLRDSTDHSPGRP